MGRLIADRTVSVRLQANVAGFIAGVRRAQAESGKMAGDLAAHAKRNEQAWEQTGRALVGLGLAAGVAAGAAVKVFADFDKQMSAVQAATLASSKEMKGLRDAAVQAGADTSFSAGEAANAIEELAKAGISTADIIGGGLTGALDLAAAGGLGVADAAEIAATTMVQFGLEGNEVARVADALAAGAGKAQGSVQDLGLALSYAGVPAASLGLSVEETTGTLALFANAGITGEKAGTAFRAMLVSMQNPAAKSANLMSSLGINMFNAQGEFVGMEAAAGILQDKLGDLTDQQRGAALATIFGNESLGAATSLYNGGAHGVATWTANVSEAGYASEVAAARLDNLAGDIEAFTGSLETLLIGLGESGDGPLREFVQDATTVVNILGELPDGVRSTVMAVGGLTTAVGLAGGAFFLALPKMVAANATLATMGPLGREAARGLSALGRSAGPIGIALAGIATVGYLAFDSYVDQKQAVDDYVSSLDELTGAATEATRAVAVKTLEEKGALEAAKRLGISTRQLVDAIVEGGPAYDEMAARLAVASDENLALSEAQVATGGTATQASQDIYLLQGMLEGESEALTEAEAKARRMAEAQDGVAGSAGEAFREVALLSGAVDHSAILAAEAVAPTDDMAASVQGVGEEAESTEDKLDNLSDALDDLLGMHLSVTQATDATEQALADLAERAVDADGKVESLSGGITENTQAARDNRAAFNETMETITAEAEARVRSGEDITTVTARIYKSRDALIAEMRARGATKDQAEEYTAVLLDIPGTIKTYVETPGMALAKKEAKELAAILQNMPKNLKISTEVFTSEAKRDLATARRGAIGDVAGSFNGVAMGGGGGKAYARVRASLPAGLRITSTYRSPAHNARVGGSPTSKHMDRNNPATDIGGPTHLLDAYAAQLAQMGGWRQLLWRVPGHYDHIHVAHQGGTVSSSWYRSPGDGPDERTTRLQVGEVVIPKSEVGAAKYGRAATFSGAGASGGGASSRALSIAVRTDGTDGAQRIASAVVREQRFAEAINSTWGDPL